MHRHSQSRVETAADTDAWREAALSRLSRLPDVRRIGLALVEGGGRRLRFTASDRPAHDEDTWCHIDAYEDVPINTALRTGRPIMGSLTDLEERYAEFVARQEGTPTVALAVIPVVVAEQVLGGYVLFFQEQQPFDDEQRRELAALAEDVGVALRSAQRGDERSDTPWSDEPAPPGGVTAYHPVTHTPAGVGQARRFLRGVLQDWGVDEDSTFAAVLCLSELVTNAVIHTRGGSVVRVVLAGGVLMVTVRDRGRPADFTSVERADDPLRVSGRGLQLVDAMADRWGSELDSVGSSVWFALDL